MPFKREGDSSDMYRCCLCCHVRTGTTLIGITHLFVNFCVIAALAVAFIHPELMRQYEASIKINFDIGSVDSDSYELKQANSTSFVSPREDPFFWTREKPWTKENKLVTFLLAVGSCIFTLMLVYGVIRKRASYLVPFFCLQVFELCLSCLFVLGYFSYISDFKTWIQLQPNIPFKEQLLQMDNDWLMLAAILTVVAILTMKVYLLGVVWACYKYLHANERSGVLAGMMMRTYRDDGTLEDTEMLLPPKYEDAMSMPVYEMPLPPAYADTTTTNNNNNNGTN